MTFAFHKRPHSTSHSNINQGYQTQEDLDEVRTAYSGAPRRTLHPHSEAAFAYKVTGTAARNTVLSTTQNMNRSSNNLYGGVRQ